MPFVLDASVSLSWYLPAEQNEYAQGVLASLDDDTAVVPGLWLVEFTNGLVVAEQRNRLTSAGVSHVHRIVADLPITLRNFTLDETLGTVLNLARAEQLSAYDASYLALAMREGIPLATLDNRIKAAATRVGVKLVR